MSEVDISAFRNSSSQRSTYSSQGTTSFAPRSYTPRQSTSSQASGSSNMSVRDNTLPGTQPRYSQASSNGGREGATGTRQSSGSRRQVNLSSIEKSVTHLLVATKQLLETLTAWSRGNASEAEVSDVYVRLGSEFNNACRSFMAIGVETADLGNVPDELRTILESTLSQDASQESLEVYLPRIREIIINLLHGLRRKQSKLRARQQKEQEAGAAPSGSRSSGERTPSGRPVPRVAMPDMPDMPENEPAPPRSSSLPQRNTPPTADMQPPARSGTPSSAEVRLPRQRQGSGQAGVAGSLQQPPAGPRNASPAPPLPTHSEDDPAARFIASSPGPPPPPPPAQEALAALQRENALERRASRRYSLYQSQTIAKLTGSSASDVQMIPSGGRTARKRESKDSSDAIRLRQSLRVKPKPAEPSPVRNANRISEEGAALVKPPKEEPVAELNGVPEPKAQTPAVEREAPTLKVDAGASPPHTPKTSEETPGSPVVEAKPKAESRSATPASQKETIVFLQIGRAIKKCTLPDDEDLSMNSIRLLFISKFAYSPPSGENFPEIYLQDPSSGVRYELEDLSDVKDRSVLCLNVEVLDEVKRHIDDGIQDLKKLVEGVKGQVEVQNAALQKVSEAQKEAATKLANLSIPAAAPISPSTSADRFRVAKQTSFSAGSEQQIREIQNLRKELGTLREKYSSFVDTATSSLKQLKIAAANAPPAAAGTSTPNSGRVYVESGKKLLSGDTDTLVTRVDDLQDTVEDLRKDVVQRGVRPLPRKLEEVSKEIARARSELKKMADYIRREKPLWKKVWERELETVCEDQQFCNMQEELVADLEDDLDKAATTFSLVEQCTQQQLNSPFGPVINTGTKFAQRDLELGSIDPKEVAGNLLSEVRGLKPNHQSRVEAIEKAERARQKAMANKDNAFQKELGEFVGEGKLKSLGGMEELEKQRQIRDEEARKIIWQAAQEAEAAEIAAEEEAARQEAAAAAGSS